MKQHITPNQFLELSKKGRKKLIKYMVNKGYIPYFDKLPILSIGQMIEFLDGLEKIEIDFFLGYKYKNISWVFGVELCDALWEACREVLETKH